MELTADTPVKVVALKELGPRDLIVLKPQKEFTDVELENIKRQWDALWVGRGPTPPVMILAPDIEMEED